MANGKARVLMRIESLGIIVIVGLILLISWGVRFMVQREVNKRKH